jgi:hypothetical protein
MKSESIKVKTSNRANSIAPATNLILNWYSLFIVLYVLPR